MWIRKWKLMGKKKVYALNFTKERSVTIYNSRIYIPLRAVSVYFCHRLPDAYCISLFSMSYKMFPTWTLPIGIARNMQPQPWTQNEKSAHPLTDERSFILF